MTASAALRQAQIAMYKDPRYSSPFHWAAFTVQGDYQRVPDIARSYGLALPVILLGVFVSLGGLYFKRRRSRTRTNTIANT